MRHALKLHPTSTCHPVTLITVEVERTTSGGLVLHYALSGDTSALLVPPKDKPERTDDLWHHTCFEVFIARGQETAYREFNLSPSTRWAAYRFTSYREGMANLDQTKTPAIEFSITPDTIELKANVNSDLPGNEAWRLAVSAVIEEKSGHKSYWALSHPNQRPDFHNADSFTLSLPSR